MNWQAIFFDFDGVILDSVDVKTRAFAALYETYGPEIEKAVVDYHLAHGGVSRFEKFKYYQETLLGQNVTEEDLQNLGRRFANLALEKVLEAPFIAGALKTLQEIKEKKIPAFVVSGTPDEEIKLIVEKRNLKQYFLEVHGSPREKAEIIADIAERHNLQTKNCLLFGDAMTDYDAGKSTGIIFCGIIKPNESSPFPPDTYFLREIMLPDLQNNS